MTPPSNRLERLRELASSAGIFLDFDGTLSEIVARPEHARPVPGAADLVTGLARAFRVVVVVSGRPADEVAALLGSPDARYEGSYGLSDAPAPAGLLPELEAIAAEVPGAWVEPKGVSVAVHFRGAADPVSAGAVLGSRVAPVAARYGLEVIEGKMVLELVPAGVPRKGGVVERVTHGLGLRGVLYAGDDAPDLEAFEAVDRLAADGVATLKVAVRGAETPEALIAAADIVVDGPAALLVLLARLR